MNLDDFFSRINIITYEKPQERTKEIKEFLNYIKGEISEKDMQSILEFIQSGRYHICWLYAVVFSSFQCLINHGVWNESLAKAYYEYLDELGWDYELENAF